MMDEKVFAGSMIIPDTPTRDEFKALQMEVAALRADIMYISQELSLLKLRFGHESTDEAIEEDPPEDDELGDAAVVGSMFMTDKPYRRHDG